MNSDNNITIDLEKLGGPVFIGRPKGEAARKKYNLDHIDNTDTKVIVLVPENAYSLNSSFFLGLFGKSISLAGSREKFLNKYEFRAPIEVKKDIDKYITRALYEKNPLI